MEGKNNCEIENEFLKVVIKTSGAELGSIIQKHTGLEYLWQGGAGWPRQSPVLFPVVGQLKNNEYIYRDIAYTLERHGFARNKIFSVSNASLKEAVFYLEEDEQTLSWYPFTFRLTIRYTLDHQLLHTHYEVSNTDQKILYFSIGAHPAFLIPLTPEEAYEDYFLKFNKKEKAVRHMISGGLMDTVTKPVLENTDLLPLSKPLFYDDALVFKGLQSDCISIRNRINNRGLDFHFSGFPYFGIWSARDAGFVCLEPWHGLADSVNHSGRLEEKECILKLEPGESFHCAWSIRPY